MKFSSILVTVLSLAIVDAHNINTSPSSGLVSSSPLLEKRTGCKGCRMYKRSEFLTDDFQEGQVTVDKRTGGCRCPCFCARGLLERRSIALEFEKRTGGKHKCVSMCGGGGMYGGGMYPPTTGGMFPPMMGYGMFPGMYGMFPGMGGMGGTFQQQQAPIIVNNTPQQPVIVNQPNQPQVIAQPPSQTEVIIVQQPPAPQPGQPGYAR